jgi:hypothetical protein
VWHKAEVKELPNGHARYFTPLAILALITEVEQVTLSDINRPVSSWIDNSTLLKS